MNFKEYITEATQKIGMNDLVVFNTMTEHSKVEKLYGIVKDIKDDKLTIAIITYSPSAKNIKPTGKKTTESLDDSMVDIKKADDKLMIKDLTSRLDEYNKIIGGL